MKISPLQIRGLYKDLLRYGQQLKFTDKQYFKNRIQAEFKESKKLIEDSDINCCYQVKKTYCYAALLRALISEGTGFVGTTNSYIIMHQVKKLFGIFNGRLIRFKHTIDLSKVPKLADADLEEQFVRGSGPGGQATNKTSNAVVLKHLPTGIVVKCHHSRSREQNRTEARRLLITKLDNMLNDDKSVEAQKQAILDKKSADRKRKQNKLALLKQKWKERES